MPVVQQRRRKWQNRWKQLKREESSDSSDSYMFSPLNSLTVLIPTVECTSSMHFDVQPPDSIL